MRDDPVRRANFQRIVVWNAAASALWVAGGLASGTARDGLWIAALIVEPVPANMGVVPPGVGFLEGIRELCSRHGALLVFDEVMTGFRVALGGAQALRGFLDSLGASIHPSWHFGLLARGQFALGVSYVCDLVRGASDRSLRTIRVVVE